MTHRSFSIVAKDDRFGLAITTTYEKSNKGNKHIIYGYFSAKAANNDNANHRGLRSFKFGTKKAYHTGVLKHFLTFSAPTKA
jgi:hypothetical protein